MARCKVARRSAAAAIRPGRLWGRSQRRRPAGSIKDAAKVKRKLGLKATRCALRLVGPLHPRHRTNTQWQSHIYLDQSVKRVWRITTAAYYAPQNAITRRRLTASFPYSIDFFFFLPYIKDATLSLLHRVQVYSRWKASNDSFLPFTTQLLYRPREAETVSGRSSTSTQSLCVCVFLVESFVYIIRQMPDPGNQSFLFLFLVKLIWNHGRSSSAFFF
jgi:hypothetical protein